MNRIGRLCAAVLLLIGGSGALAQDEGFPPELVLDRWTVFDFITGEETIVFQLNPPIGTLGGITRFPHKEYDTVIADVRLLDFDWDIAKSEAEAEATEPNMAPERPDYEGNFLGLRGFSIELFSPTEFDVDFFFGNFFRTTGPISPPLLGISPGELNLLEGPGGANDEGYTPNVNSFPGDPGRPFAQIQYAFQFPEFVGRRQDRLQNPDGDLFDSGFIISFDAGPEESENTTVDERSPEFVVISLIAFVGVNDNPSFAPGNGPAFAGALAPNVVESGQTVILDGTRTFDGTNVGFNPLESPDDNDVLDRDFLTYAWEWLSGPVRVDPEQENADSPFAEVVLVEPGTYTYRLIVSDNSGNPPTSDTVKIEVVEQLAFNNAPVPFIQGPTDGVQVGEIITLDGSLSSDADGDTLKYQWRQTNAFGEPLAPSEIQSAFQPLSGTTAVISQWQAVEAGTFYFTLLVSDGKVRPTAQYVVKVVDNGTQGTVDQDDDQGAAGGLDDDLTVNPIAAPACGLGLMPLALTPLLLTALRRRR